MKVKVLSRSENELKIEIQGEDHTLCGLLQKALLDDRYVEFAGYEIAHPLVSEPTVYLRTKGRRKPEKALIRAAEKIGDTADKFKREFERALGRTAGSK